MNKIYFSVVGLNHYYGSEFFEPKMHVKLVKEPDNKYDKEAIKVELPGLGLVGYVANSPYTVIGESYSAGRIYDKIGETAVGTVLYKTDKGILCELLMSKPSESRKPEKKNEKHSKKKGKQSLFSNHKQKKN